jgi:hypothetical protein
MLHNMFIIGLWLLDENNSILTSELLQDVYMNLNFLHSEIITEWYLM